MNYGFIGAGNIATAIVAGALRSGAFTAEQFYVCDSDDAAQKPFVERFGVNGCAGIKELANHAGILFLAVKPGIYPGLLPAVSNNARERGNLLVSLAAGHTLEAIDRMGCEGLPVVRVMPNMNAAVCESVNALCANAHVAQARKQQVLEFFSATGLTLEIDEGLFSVFSAIAGCSPAFTYMYMDALARGAQKNGMNKRQALQISAQAVLGSARMLLESGQHPAELMDRVCSPGGTTIEGVCALADDGFESAVVHAVDAVVQKDKGLRG